MLCAVTRRVNLLQSSIKKDVMDSKLMSSLLVGVYRAFPFAKGKIDPCTRAVQLLLEKALLQQD